MALPVVFGMACTPEKEDTAEDSSTPSTTETPWYDVDYDGDGYSVAEHDCDNEDATVYPGAPDDPTDGVDSDCDGTEEDVGSDDTGGTDSGEDPEENPDPDADQDGILDADDDCPDTDVAEAVDSEGCSDDQRDSDNDGVSDADDLCADEDASGHDQDSDGCIDEVLPPDTDSDGVIDIDDQCPDTDSTDPVDSDGCADAQRDDDGDGLTETDGDCNDALASVSPDAVEIPGDGVDQDCDGDPDNGSEDYDGDGLTNDQELSGSLNDGEATDPTEPDTDVDGVTDGDEVSDGTDPLDTDSDDDCTPDGADSDPLDDSLPVNPELGSTTAYATVYHDVDGDGSFFCAPSYGSGANVALNQPVTATVGGDTNVCSEADHPAGCWPENLVDGDTGTLALPGTTSFDYSVDLGSTHALESSLLNWGGYALSSGYINSWTLEATLDDASTVTLATEASYPNATQTLVVLSSAGQALGITDVRISSYNNTNWVGMNELSAFEL